MALSASEVLTAFTSEKEFQQQVMDLLRLCGWRAYHTYDSRRSPEGFPDICAVRGPRLLYAELKRQRVKSPTPAQLAWLEDLRNVAGVEVYVWRPADWYEIVEVVKR